MIRSKAMFKLIEQVKESLYFQSETSNTVFRIMILEDKLIRVLSYETQLTLEHTWLIAPGMEDVPYEGRDRLDVSPFTCPTFEWRESEGFVEIRTQSIKLFVDLNGMKMSWYVQEKNGDTLFLQDRKTQAYNIDHAFEDGVYHYVERNNKEAYYGLGERSGNVNKYGQRFKMENVDPMGYDAQFTDPLYKHIPFYITRNSETKIAFGLFYDNLSTSHFDMGKELDNYHGAYRYYYAEAGDLDYYVILGPSLPQVTKTVSWMTGQTILPPKWSLGYSGSTMSYTDAPKSQEKLMQFLADCRRYDIPCQSFQLSSGYTSIGNKRYVFHWNTEKFPDIHRLSDSFKENGLNLCANIKPALLIDHPQYEQLEEHGLFIKNRNFEETETAQFWDEIGAYVDFTNPSAFQWWKDQVTVALLEKGIESTWNDNNEYEIWDGKAKAFGFGKTMPVELIKPLFTLLMMKASYEAQKEYAPHLRPYLISRSGCPGMQRYVQTWSGDNRTDYKTIKFNSKMGIGLSLSGIYNFGHDIGGFSGPAPEEELFIRWIQNGLFHPRFTIHSWNDDQTVNVPWMYENCVETVRHLMIFRMQLVPYLYHLLYRAHSFYEPMIRPTFYNYEFDEKTFEENDEFMLGEDVLVASVFVKGQRERSLYLPEDPSGWYDFHHGTWYEGGSNVTVPAPLDEATFFLRGGSILPLNTAVKGFDSKEDEARTYRIYPIQGTGTFSRTFYEDDGRTMEYASGKYALVTIEVTCDATQILIKRSVTGKYTLPYEHIDFIVPKTEKRVVKILEI